MLREKIDRTSDKEVLPMLLYGSCHWKRLKPFEEDISIKNIRLNQLVFW